MAGAAVVLAGCLAAGTQLCAQAPAANNTQAQDQKKQAPAPAPPAANTNPFPDDVSSVPVLPTRETPDLPPGSFGGADGRAALPAGDVDPVQSPDEGPASSSTSQGYSSSQSGLENLLPGPADEEPARHGKRQDKIAPEHHETAKEDENVGKYYLDNKNWRAALSRYQSALVLDPENPEVYWGLAESSRYLGDYAAARGYYLKVMEYDPDSKHAKDAKKALSLPELVDAKPTAAQK